MKMVKILMVCLGNICRSPLAEGIMKTKTVDMDVTVDSAGTTAYHSGEAPDPRSVHIAGKYGVDISMQRARQFTAEDFTTFDHIFVMDSSNYTNVIKLAESEAQKAKVELILNRVNAGHNMAVPDPYYGGDQGFENVYQLLDKACNHIAESLKK